MPGSTTKSKKTVTAKQTRRIPAPVLNEFIKSFDSGDLTIEVAVGILRSHGFSSYTMLDDLIAVDDPSSIRSWLRKVMKIVHDVDSRRDIRKLKRLSDVLTMTRNDMRIALDDRNLKEYQVLLEKYSRLQEVVNKIVASGTVV